LRPMTFLPASYPCGSIEARRFGVLAVNDRRARLSTGLFAATHAKLATSKNCVCGGR
jgi:hypothetical protein